ncbi:MAG: CoA pyrophosphatase [Hyphomicrobiales bacterium]|nr:CoA pyrophosphatase [Hyphomicrobiales bacterium]
METLQQSDETETAFTADELRRRARGILAEANGFQAPPVNEPARRGDFDLNPDVDPAIRTDTRKRPAAILVPVIDRAPEATVILTQRTAHLRTHAGQISFPGGSMEAGDATPVETALRETQEEIGIEPEHVDVIGFLETYQTSTGFRVAPAVGIVSPDFTLQCDGEEVDDVFEVPLKFLMNAENHELHSRPWRGSRRYYYAIPYQDRYIWGATAGMLRNLYDWLYR